MDRRTGRSVPSLFAAVIERHCDFRPLMYKYNLLPTRTHHTKAVAGREEGKNGGGGKGETKGEGDGARRPRPTTRRPAVHRPRPRRGRRRPADRQPCSRRLSPAVTVAVDFQRPAGPPAVSRGPASARGPPALLVLLACGAPLRGRRRAAHWPSGRRPRPRRGSLGPAVRLLSVRRPSTCEVRPRPLMSLSESAHWPSGHRVRLAARQTHFHRPGSCRRRPVRRASVCRRDEETEQQSQQQSQEMESGPQMRWRKKE